MSREWPRLTPYQRKILVRFDDSRFGDLCMVPRERRSFFALKWNGMIETFDGRWYGITQRGRDYVRWAIRGKAARGPEPETK